MVLVAFHLDEKLNRDFKIRVAERGQTKSFVLRKAVQEYLDN